MSDSKTSNLTSLTGHFASDEEVYELVRRLEACALAPDDFKHSDHLAVALIYVLQGTDEEAHARVRESILRLLKHHKISAPVYHETITAFWVRRVRAFVNRSGTHRSLHQLANELSAECADSRLFFDYYSKELTDTDAARAGWVEPDLKAFDF